MSSEQTEHGTGQVRERGAELEGRKQAILEVDVFERGTRWSAIEARVKENIYRYKFNLRFEPKRGPCFI